MKPYEKYKDSGVEWIGDIPEHWKVIKFKYVTNLMTCGHAATPEYVDEYEGVPFISAQNIKEEKITFTPLKFIKKELHETLLRNNKVERGDILQARVGGVSNIGQTAIYESDLEVSIYVSLSHIKLNRLVVNSYIKYLCNSQLYKLHTWSLMKKGGGVANFNVSDQEKIKIPLPILQEQTAIAKYLDHQTAIIDELIEKKTKQIALLKEKRQAIINETVTKGLDPTAKMKDSGVDGGDHRWLGEIPESWKIVALRHLSTKIGSGVTPKGGADVYTEEGVIFVRSQNVHFDGLRLDDVVRIEPEIHDKMSGSKVMYKDVLLNITGASIGRCSVVNIEEEMNVNQHVCIIRPNNKISSEYLNLVLQSNIGQTQVKTGTTGGNREGLTFEAIKEFIIPVPEFTAQLAIVFKVEELLKQFQNLESQNINQIEKLKEYRQSLISEAVTGKIDVRGWS